jgi:hypothetical protein
MASEQGYSNQKKKGRAQFKTIHQVNNNAYGESVIPKYLFELAPTILYISNIEDVLGSNGQVEFWKFEVISHQAFVGGIFRLKDVSTDSIFNFEFEVVSVIDADNFTVLPISDIKPEVGNGGTFWGWVTGAADAQGNPQISLAPAAVKFDLDGSLVDVHKDSATPANNIPLPVEDLVAQASLTSIDGKFSTLNAKDFATSAKQDTGNTSLNSIDGKLTTLNSKDFATSAKQDTGNSSLGSIDGKLLATGVVDPTNSTDIPLLAAANFTGAAFEITRYAAINVNVISDVPSAADGLIVQLSMDGITWDHEHKTTYAGGNGSGYIFNAEFKYARVKYINGASNQTTFKLQTIFKINPVKQSLYTIAQPVNGNMFAELGKNVIIGETTGGGGGYVAVKVNPSGALTTEASVTGTVSVSNFPATQPVSGTVAVSNFPASYPVTGTFWQATQPVSGTVDVGNFPATQVVSGTVSVGNFPATQNTAEQTSSGTITSTQKAVGTSAVRATVSGSAPSATRKKLMIKPSKNNTGAIYLGSSSVTIGNGLEIIGPDRLEFTLDASDYYIISDSTAQVVEIIEVA